jgi:hypothetical protein
MRLAICLNIFFINLLALAKKLKFYKNLTNSLIKCFHKGKSSSKECVSLSPQKEKKTKLLLKDTPFNKNQIIHFKGSKLNNNQINANQASISSKKDNEAQQSRLIPIDNPSIVTNKENNSLHLHIISQNQTPQSSLNENQSSILSNKNNEAQQSQLISIYDPYINTNSLNQSKLNNNQSNAIQNQESILLSKNNETEQSQLISIYDPYINTNSLNQPKLQNNQINTNQASISSKKGNEAQQSRLIPVDDSSINTNSLNQSKLNNNQSNANKNQASIPSNKNNMVQQQSRLIPIDNPSIVTNKENNSLHLHIISQNQTPQSSLNENQPKLNNNQINTNKASILLSKNNETEQSHLIPVDDPSINTKSLNQPKLNNNIQKSQMNVIKIIDENNQTKLIYKLSDDKIIQRFVFKTISKEKVNNTNDILILKKDEKKFNDLIEETLWFKVPNDFDLNTNKKIKFNMNNTVKNNIYITRVSKFMRFETNNSQIHDFDQLLNYQSALIYTFEDNNLDKNRFELLKYKNPFILDGKWSLNMIDNRTCNLILSLKFIKCQFKTTRLFELSIPHNTNEMRIDNFQTNNLFSQKFDIDERLNAFAMKLKIISNNNNNELDDELSISFQISLKKDEIKHNNELRFEELIRKYFIVPIDCYYFNANLFEIKSNDTSIVFEQAARQSMNILQFISEDYLINNDNHPQPLKLNKEIYIEKLTELDGLIQNLQQLENSSEFQRGKREIINFYKKIPQALNMKNIESQIIDVNMYLN